MKLAIVLLSSFERDLEQYVKKGGDVRRIRHILHLLAKGDALPPSLKDHHLQGKMRDCRELHVESDWLLVYRRDGKKLILTCIWLVSHKKLQERERNS